jgi:hypothetical protein
VGRLFFREGVKAFEERNGWSRITKFYDAFCVNNKSKYVDEGNNNCTNQNGIDQGNFSEWVLSKHISENRPPDPVNTATNEENFIAKSDDFKRYKKVFLKVSKSLIKQGKCTEKDFYNNGGWIKSFTHRNKPIYFTYCGGSTLDNKIYLNAHTQKTFK